MSKIAVSLKIAVNQIDKARLFSGAKNKYLDATVFIDLDQLDQYGNSGMITQDVTKEERQQNVKGNILGNAKVFWKENGQAPQQQGGQNYQQPAQQQAPQHKPQYANPPAPQQPATQYQKPQEFDESIPF